MSSVSWVTVVWSMCASASLTLAAIYGLIWFRNRGASAHLLFAIAAATLPAVTYCELWMMRAASSAELLEAMKWLQLPLLVVLAALTWFIAIYLDARRRWLVWLACGLRLAFVLLAFVGGQNVNIREAGSLHRVAFLGEAVTVIDGRPNPVGLLGYVPIFLMLYVIADASIGAWRRGERRKALMVGGSAEFFLLTALVTSAAVIWGGIHAPIVFSLLYLALIVVMGYELARDVLRASQLARDLQVSEAGLREQQATLEASHQQISDLFGRLIAAQETERARIARDLHDDVSQRIAGLGMMLSSVKRKLGTRGESEVVGDLAAMQLRTSELAEEIRHFSHELHPGVLQHTGLPAALRQYCAEFGKQSAATITFTAVGDTGRIDGALSLCLYRVAQEALRNVEKHAAADHVSVTLTEIPEGVELSIVDNGRGFDPSGRRGTGGGLGLVSMDERARQLGGRVHIETGPHHGTAIRLQIPWAARTPRLASAS